MSLIRAITRPYGPATAAGVNLGVGVAPLSPQDGDVWITATSIFARVGGVTHDLLA